MLIITRATTTHSVALVFFASLVMGACKEDPVPPEEPDEPHADACQGVVNWQLSGDDTLRLGPISGPSNSCYINEDGSNNYPSMFRMRAYWEQMS
jgi:hypothetical protein